MLAKVEGVENPVVIHHPSTAKGKRTLVGTTKEEFFVLQGTGNPALVYGIDPEEVFKSSGQLEAPEFRHFVRAKDTEELHDIHTREIGQGGIIKLTSAIPLLPGFTETFLKDGNGQTAEELLLLAVDEILRSMERDPPTFETNLAAADQRRVEEEDLVARGLRVVNWLHFFWQARALKAITLKPVLEGSNTKEVADKMHRELLSGQKTLTTTHDAATQQILETLLATTNNTSQLAEGITEMSNRIVNRDNQSKKGSEKIFKNSRKMILTAGTQDGGTPVDDIKKIGKDLLRQDKANFHKALIACLEKDNEVVNLSITPAAARQIAGGDWLWQGEHVPGGISSLTIPIYDQQAYTPAFDTIVLSLQTKYVMEEASVSRKEL